MTDRTVLYIEDDRASQMVVAGALRSLADVELVCAATGEDGVALADRHRPALVLLDANLPDLTGAEIMSRLADAAHASPVVVVSADVASPRVDLMLEAGAVGCIAKPLDIDELIETVGRFVA